MSTAAIEIHDAGVVAFREGAARPLVESPAYAVFDGKALLTGGAALRKARLLPRHCCTRLWDPIDRRPLPRPFPSKLTPADLAHAHLSSIWREVGRGMDRALLLVPGFYGEDELGLLLGIARACDIPVAALVDLALAAVADTDVEVAIHLDIHLHRAVGERIAGTDVIAREMSVSDESVGLTGLYDEWAKLVSKKFVWETRCDPLHGAESEQRLYDRLPHLLLALSERETAALSMETGAKDLEVEFTRQELLDSALPYYRKISELVRSLDPEGSWPRIFLSPTLARLPGLSELLARDAAPLVSALPIGAPSRNALARRRGFPRRSAADESVPFVTRLLRKGDEAPPAVVAPPLERKEAEAEAVTVPTHVLFEGVAHPIEPLPFLLGTAIPEGHRGLNLDAAPGVSRYHCTIDRMDGRLVVEDHSRYGSFVNGHRVEGKTPLNAGDRLRLGAAAVEVVLIGVES